MAFIDILGANHAYELTPPPVSPSPVLVFIHGWLLSRNYWQPLIDTLAPDYQCLTYDLRGFGDSQPPRIKLKTALSYSMLHYRTLMRSNRFLPSTP
jgi:pimeloyl-ACP methyl ester carboxylesterase